MMREMSETTEEKPDKISSNKVNNTAKTGDEKPLRRNRQRSRRSYCVSGKVFNIFSWVIPKGKRFQNLTESTLSLWANMTARGRRLMELLIKLSSL
jgi:hypothetical protein